MSIQNLAQTSARINKYKGEILAHAMPVEVLGITGQQKQLPKNSSRTISFRRWLPYGATVNNPNQWSVDAVKHITQEGVTPAADTLTPQDIEVPMQQYAVLYAVTDQMVDMHEDGPAIVDEMKKQVGERLGLVREMVRYGTLKGCTNKYYAGGTSRTTVSTKITLPLLRKMTRGLKANHAKFITGILAPSPNYGTSAVESSYLVFAHTDVEQDIRDITGFKEVAIYGSRKPMHEMELGSVENFRFILSPELQSIPDAGAAVGATGMYSTSGANVDVYPVIVTGDSAWGQVALRGRDSIDVSVIMPGQKDKNDPLGQRGYIGATNYFAAVILNNGWVAVAEVATSSLA
jgi:N4-gp56 family major capsid protein